MLTIISEIYKHLFWNDYPGKVHILKQNILIKVD